MSNTHIKRYRPWLASACFALALVAGPARPAGAMGLDPQAWFDATAESRQAGQEPVIRTCRVSSIHDGDSMRARCPGFKDTLRIRLEQIDAPELDQAYGVASRDYLRELCPRGQQVIIHDMGLDIYNRHLGRVYCQGVDVNAAMVRAGAAWVYDHYADDPELYRLQTEARTKRRGLWARRDPVAPWTFRYRQRKAKGQ